MIIGYVLLVFGIGIFIASFLIPVKPAEDSTELSEEIIKHMVDREVDSAKDHLNGIVDETITYAMEKTERSIDRLTNEKMMAVNEYSDTVLSEINKNHNEVMFLYDMLNDKHENIKETVSEVDKKTTEVKQAVIDAELKARETQEQVLEAKGAAEEAARNAEKAKQATYSTAIERLQGLKALDPPKEETVEVEFSPLAIQELEKKAAQKPPRKKRTTKPKVKEEAVVMQEEHLDSTLELIQSPDVEDVILKSGPNLNFGSEAPGKATGGRNNNERILELHKAGKSNMAIAKELGLGIGEVKFVIGLFEGK